MVREALKDLAPEERHPIYKLLRLGVRFRPDWLLEITGIFAEVGEEAERFVVLQTFVTWRIKGP